MGSQDASSEEQVLHDVARNPHLRNFRLVQEPWMHSHPAITPVGIRRQRAPCTQRPHPEKSWRERRVHMVRQAEWLYGRISGL